MIRTSPICLLFVSTGNWIFFLFQFTRNIMRNSILFLGHRLQTMKQNLSQTIKPPHWLRTSTLILISRLLSIATDSVIVRTTFTSKEWQTLSSDVADIICAHLTGHQSRAAWRTTNTTETLHYHMHLLYVSFNYFLAFNLMSIDWNIRFCP